MAARVGTRGIFPCVLLQACNYDNVDDSACSRVFCVGLGFVCGGQRHKNPQTIKND